MNVKQIAAQIVAALPADAHFQDLEEFLFERAEVEEGREDFEASRVAAAADVLGAAAASLSDVVWAQSAAAAFRSAIDASGRSSGEFTDPVLAALRTLGRSGARDLSLPEMGDPSIRERHVEIAARRYRILYDTRGSTYRILWFTNNVTCYRNVRPSP
jgi:hypothetical protein